MCVFFSALDCLPRGSSLRVHRLRYFTAKGKSLSQLHISVSAVHCSCQHSKSCRVCARLISQLKFISTLFIYYIFLSQVYGLCQVKTRTIISNNPAHSVYIYIYTYIYKTIKNKLIQRVSRMDRTIYCRLLWNMNPQETGTQKSNKVTSGLPWVLERATTFPCPCHQGI